MVKKKEGYGHEVKRVRKRSNFDNSSPYQPQNLSLFEDDSVFSTLGEQQEVFLEQQPDKGSLFNLLEEAQTLMPETDYQRMLADVTDHLSPGEFELYQLMAEPPSQQRLQKLRQLLTAYPDNQLILFQYLVEQDGMMGLDYLELMHRLEKLALRDWQAIHYQGKNEPTGRGETCLDSFDLLLSYYFLMGFYKKADKLCQFVLDHLREEPEFSLVRFDYARLTIGFRLDDLTNRPVKSKGERIVRLLHLTIAYLLDAEIDMAKSTFDQLVALTPAAVPYFSYPKWETDVPGSFGLFPEEIEFIGEALMPLSGFLLSQSFACGQLTAFAQEWQSKQGIPAGLPPFLKTNHQSIQKALNSLLVAQEPHFKGIGHHLVIKLTAKGYCYPEDFKKVTETELLKIPGIGKGTVKKLRDNGVTFKQPRQRK